MFALSKLAINYAIFALIATAANISAQDLLIRAYSGEFSVIASVTLGTGVGLVVKYILDKRYIFRFQARSVGHDTRIFALYTVMGMATTMIFWGFEFGFHHVFETKEMRYLGGGLGRARGYWPKTHLHKRYVFRAEPG